MLTMGITRGARWSGGRNTIPLPKRPPRPQVLKVRSPAVGAIWGGARSPGKWGLDEGQSLEMCNYVA